MTRKNKLVSLIQRLSFCFSKKRTKSQFENKPEMISINDMIIDDQERQTTYDVDFYFDQLFDQDTILIEKFLKNASLAQPEQSDIED